MDNNNLGRVPTEPGSRASTEPLSGISAASGFDPSRDEGWHRIIATVGPILKAGFPEAHIVTRLQVAEAIATALEHLTRRARAQDGETSNG